MAMSKMAIDKLMDAIDITKAPIVVGLDPRLQDIPKAIRDRAETLAGRTKEGAALAIYEFNKGLIDALNGMVPAVKPQIAFYEQYGFHGIKAYEETIAYAKAAGLLVIGDVKRNDIGSTAEAYADGHIGRVDLWGETVPAFDTDFLTVNPYLGSDGIKPFLKWSGELGKGIFALVRTSNPSATEVQDLVAASSGLKVYQEVGELIGRLGLSYVGTRGYSALGAVVGATYPEESGELRRRLPGTYFLVPGYGAQGAGVDDVMPAFGDDGYGAVVNSSRGIIYAYRAKGYEAYGESGYQDAARAAVEAMRDDINRALDKKLSR